MKKIIWENHREVSIGRVDGVMVCSAERVGKWNATFVGACDYKELGCYDHLDEAQSRCEEHYAQKA